MPSPGLSLAKARARSTFLLCGGGGWVDGCGGQRKASDVTNTGAMRSYLLRQIWVWPRGLPGAPRILLRLPFLGVLYACAVHPWGRSWGQGEHDCQWRSTKAGNNLYKSFLPFHRVGSRAGTEATSLAASIPKPSSPRAAQPHPLPSRPAFFNPSHLLFYNLTFQDGCMRDMNGTIRTSLRTGSLCPAQLPADSPTPFTRDQSCQ